MDLFERKRRGPPEHPDNPRYRRLMRVLKAARSMTSPDGAFTEEDLARQRRAQEVLGRLVAPMGGMQQDIFSLLGMPAAWIAPAGDPMQSRPILYLHGGGYTSGNLGYASVLAAKLAHVTGHRVLAFEYPLAPEHPYPAALDAAEEVWRMLLYQGWQACEITVAGDSAGGNLALALTTRLRQAGMQLPRGLILFSPWTDFLAQGRSYAERAGLDPMISLEYVRATARAYADGRDFADPVFSPVCGSLDGFPPTLIQVGDHEVLLSDAIRLRNRMERDGVPCRLEVWRDMWHVFQMFPLKRADRAMEHVGAFFSGLP